MSIDLSSHASCFANLRDTKHYRTIKCNRFGRLYCIVLLIDNWNNYYNIYENEIVKFGQSIELSILKRELENVSSN